MRGFVTPSIEFFKNIDLVVWGFQNVVIFHYTIFFKSTVFNMTTKIIQKSLNIRKLYYVHDGDCKFLGIEF